MDEPKNDDHVEKIRDIVTIDIEHELSEAELKQIAMQLASLYSEVEQAEERKKNVASQHKNAIDALKVEVKKLSTYINTGFQTQPRVAELFLDYGIQKRMYYDKRTGDLLLEKSFEEEDYQKKINFYAKQEQIDYNNAIGDFAEGDLNEGTDQLDKVISEKKETPAEKKARIAKEGKMLRDLLEKPTPKDNLHPKHGADLEYQEDQLPGDDELGVDRNGNPTDIKADMVDPDLFAKADEDSLPPEGN